MQFQDDLLQAIFAAGEVYSNAALGQAFAGEADPELWERALDCFVRLDQADLEPAARARLATYRARCHIGLALAEAITAANYPDGDEQPALVQSLSELLGRLQ